MSFDPTFIIALLVALSVHEWAHAWVADLLGDHTARDMGRLTVNPIAHLDLMGTIMFFVIGFGWGKPVPVDPRNFRHPLRDSALVAIAGPISNIVLAFGALFGLAAVAALDLEPTPIAKVLVQVLHSSVGLNLGLMAFNLLPIPPLDGSRVATALLPWRLRLRYEELTVHSQWILLGLILAENILNVPLLSIWVNLIASPVLWVLEAVVRMFL